MPDWVVAVIALPAVVVLAGMWIRNLSAAWDAEQVRKTTTAPRSATSRPTTTATRSRWDAAALVGTAAAIVAVTTWNGISATSTRELAFAGVLALFGLHRWRDARRTRHAARRTQYPDYRPFRD